MNKISFFIIGLFSSFLTSTYSMNLYPDPSSYASKVSQEYYNYDAYHAYLDALPKSDESNLGEIINLVNQNTIDVNAKDDLQQTYLIIAAKKSFYFLVRALLANSKILVNTKDKYQHTAIYYAIINNNEHIVAQLLAPELEITDISEIDNNNNNLLYIALNTPNISSRIISNLLDRNASLPQTNNSEQLLHKAIRLDRSDLVKLILKCMPHLVNIAENQVLPIQLASQLKNQNIINIINSTSAHIAARFTKQPKAYFLRTTKVAQVISLKTKIGIAATAIAGMTLAYIAYRFLDSSDQVTSYLTEVTL